jgi:hypothetical protein
MDSLLELRDRDVVPDADLLAELFGRGYPAYESLLALLGENDISCEWIYYGDVKAWLCKATKRKKTIVWMSACKGYIRATIYFPQEHIEALYGLELSEEARQRIRDQKNTGKSKGCVFEMRNKAALKDFSKVLQLKLAIPR